MHRVGLTPVVVARMRAAFAPPPVVGAPATSARDAHCLVRRAQSPPSPCGTALTKQPVARTATATAASPPTALRVAQRSQATLRMTTSTSGGERSADSKRFDEQQQQQLGRQSNSSYNHDSTGASDDANADAVQRTLHDAGFERGTDRVILYDGVCNLCNAGVNFILERDRGTKHFKYAALQTPVARALLALYRREDVNDLSTMVYIDSTREARGERAVYTHSDAAVEIGKQLGGDDPLLSGAASLTGATVPKPVRDWLYRNALAKYRYSVFGKRDVCRVSEPGMEDRFMRKRLLTGRAPPQR